MSADVVSSAILQFSVNNVYPEAEDVVTTELSPAILANVVGTLHKQRDGLKQEIRSLSKTNGPDVETWIDQAKKLQSDIQKSRDIARQIVQEHEDGGKIKAQVVDAGSKIALLEREVIFESSLRETLLQVKTSNELLLSAQDAIVGGNIEEAYERLGTAKASVGKLNAVRDTRCVVLLRERGKQLSVNLEDAVAEQWHALIRTDTSARSLTMASHNQSTSLDVVVKVAQAINTLEGLTQKLGRDIERAILKPLLSRSGQGYKTSSSDGNINLIATQDQLNLQAMFDNLEQTLSYLARDLPRPVAAPVFERLIPNLLARLEDTWLENSIPVEVSDIKSFEDTIRIVEHFTAHLDGLELGSAKSLKEWLNSIPKAWLTKRRETLLGEARNLVFQGLRETKIVERIESQMISKDDAFASQVNGDDDWDTAWDEAEEEPTPAKTAAPTQPVNDDVDSSAWDLEDTDDGTTDHTEEAWGWGDDEANAQQKTDAAKTATPTVAPTVKPTQREITFRETYTVTSVPDALLRAIQNVVSDAQALSADDYSTTTLAPAGVGLYSLPTLALAIYRATAPTAYAKLPTGNMLIYNDAMRLSERLREWQASQPPASRLRLDNDAKALDLFAKQAYGAEMDAQRTILRDLLDGAQGFSNCTASPFKEACEGAVEQTADRLQDVHREWKNVLGQNALLQSLGQLLSGVTGKVIEDIEDLSDIGEADSHQLKALCERLSVVKGLFAQQQPDGELRDMTFVYCPNWLKFQYLAEILESSLADIKYLWNEGELSLEFSAEEVIDLVEALFAESDHRRKLIGELRRQSRR